jgi:N utilization substance protein A
MVVSELRGEKIDIIPWNPEPARFVAKALSPARVREVYLDDEAKEATVVTPDDQLALAIGKEGMNARLAARLTGWRIDIQSDSEFAQAEAEAAFGGGDSDDFTGRCAAILATGKRCPNATLPGSRFCGVPAHMELAKIEAETGEYAEGTVTPQAAQAEEDADDAGEAGSEAAEDAIAPHGEITPPEEPSTPMPPSAPPTEPEPPQPPLVDPSEEPPLVEPSPSSPVEPVEPADEGAPAVPEQAEEEAPAEPEEERPDAA